MEKAIGACRRAGLVAPVPTITVVIVDLAKWDYVAAIKASEVFIRNVQGCL